MYPCPKCDYRGGHLQGGAENGTTVCPKCDTRYDITWLPLFVITGGGGCGKTTVGETLVGRLDKCLVIEMDPFAPLRKAGKTIQDYWEYLLFVAMSLSRNGRPVVLCGWVSPSQIEKCPTSAFFPTIYTLVLACDEATQTARLEGRYPKRRKSPVTAEYIEESIRGTRLLKEEMESRPNATVLDTTGYSRDQTVSAAERWILERLDD
jgi:broad-specificity NMP kinase